MAGEFRTGAVMGFGQRHLAPVINGITVLPGIKKTKEWTFL